MTHRELEIGLHMAPPGQGQLLDRARWAEEHGFDSLWIPDGAGRMDGFTMAAGMAPVTERVRLCLGIVPVYTRPAAVIATSAMTMTYLAPGRFVLGLGSSSHTMIERWYGTPFVKPLTRVRETVAVVREMLAGGKVSFEGETFYSRDFRLGLPVRSPVPIYLAGLRPRMLELAGEVADGVILNLVPLEVLPRILEHIDTGAKRAGRRVEDLEIAAYLYAYVTADHAAACREMAEVAAAYFSTPVYSRFLGWMGYEKEAAMILEGFRERDRAKTLGAFSDEVLHRLGIIGSAEACRATVRRYAAAGLDVPVIAAASGDPAVFEATVQALSGTAFATDG